MSSREPIDAIIDWATQKLQPWQSDALRRFAAGGILSNEDEAELLAWVKHKAGLSVPAPTAAPVLLTKGDFSGVMGGDALKLLSIRNVQNVNRLAPGTGIDFAPEGLTVVYGRNGSGKSGFVRILRCACRTRIENASILKVLSNVYGAVGGPQTAEIVIDSGGGETILPWTAGAGPSAELLQAAVFDSAAASLYVDQGHQIRFLPFGLALPHKLNGLCLSLRTKLESERLAVGQKLALATVTFDAERETQAQKFYRSLTGKASDELIEQSARFSAADAERLGQIEALLAADPDSAADLKALATWIDRLRQECDGLSAALSDEAFSTAETLVKAAQDAREAAGLDAEALFRDEPLPGVGAGAWRALWVSARDYSLGNAYVGKDFPVLKEGEEPANCVLCHQPLGPEAANRMRRFREFMEGALSDAAGRAEEAVRVALGAVPALTVMNSADWSARVDQLTARDSALADQVSAYKAAAAMRRTGLQSLLSGVETMPSELPKFESPATRLTTIGTKLVADAEARAEAGQDEAKARLRAELAELSDRKVLSANVAQLKSRRDLLREDAAYQAALKEVQTKPITEAANKFVDEHLTAKVLSRFDVERKHLEIDHLRIGLARKSSQTAAAFQTTPGTTSTKSASDILSEGEQRALALSAFLTEIAMTDGAGPMIVDDPVSSLDRERCVKVAVRIAAEARDRQSIVFTHDLVFFNDLCREADALGVPVSPVALFANKVDAGRVDPAGVVWKGLPVAKRLNLIKAAVPSVVALHDVSQADYEFQVKGLYGRLRDTYERVVEECIFRDVLSRAVDRVETLKLRYVHLSDDLAVRFHEGMTRANTFSHDNPAAETVEVPDPTEFKQDLEHLERLIADLETESKATEGRRPSMKPKK